MSDIRWSTLESLAVWADVFSVSTRTMARYFKSNVVRHRKRSSKLYQVDLLELPEKWRRRFGELNQTKVDTKRHNAGQGLSLNTGGGLECLT
jgi:hypothetical protein